MGKAAPAGPKIARVKNPGEQVDLVAGVVGCPTPRGVFVVVVRGVNGAAEIQLAQIIDALNALGPLLGARQRRQQHRRENGDDGDDDEQFNQRECAEGATQGGDTAWLGRGNGFHKIFQGVGF